MFSQKSKAKDTRTDEQIVADAHAEVDGESEFHLDANKQKETESDAAQEDIATDQKAKLQDQLLAKKQKGLIGKMFVEDQAIVEGKDDDLDLLDYEESD